MSGVEGRAPPASIPSRWRRFTYSGSARDPSSPPNSISVAPAERAYYEHLECMGVTAEEVAEIATALAAADDAGR